MKTLKNEFHGEMNGFRGSKEWIARTEWIARRWCQPNHVFAHMGNNELDPRLRYNAFDRQIEEWDEGTQAFRRLPTLKPGQLRLRPGYILNCYFSCPVGSELIKRRPVVIVARHGYEMHTVVPLSGSEPRPYKPSHLKLDIDNYPVLTKTCWAKCDEITTISIRRSSMDQA